MRFLEEASVAGYVCYGRNRLEGVYIGWEFKNGRSCSLCCCHVGGKKYSVNGVKVKGSSCRGWEERSSVNSIRQIAVGVDIGRVWQQRIPERPQHVSPR